MQQVPPDEGESVFPPNDSPQEIETGLWRIPVPLPFALRSANIYLLDNGAAGWAIVDSGFGLPADEAALRAGLAHADVSLDAITTIFLTHAHPDHIGLSGTIQAASGAPVYMLAREDQRMYDVWSADADPSFEAVTAMYAANCLPPDEVASSATATARVRRILRLPRRNTVHLLEDGETLRLGGFTYTAIWTPGHSDYHMCLLRDDNVFIAGDHILPSITPNIGLYPHSRPDPLRDYFNAIQRVRDLPTRTVLPGHGRPFSALAERVDALRIHHEERGAAVLDVVRQHPTGISAYALASIIFGGRLRTSDDRRFALVEMLAHLEYLCGEGYVAREDLDGQIVYTTSVQTPASRRL
ncbi:MAG TPA: MBL fold metallo-hydrolase [Ktedonobacterales bacterium]|nr:MBL fold metallo-hydrolase [Ktedonobacterales bacterium]